jgi:hypothetical protein
MLDMRSKCTYNQDTQHQQAYSQFLGENSNSNSNGEERSDSKGTNSSMRTPGDHRLTIPGNPSSNKQSRRQGRLNRGFNPKYHNQSTYVVEMANGTAPTGSGPNGEDQETNPLADEALLNMSHNQIGGATPD